jgi:hypothetical protein
MVPPPLPIGVHHLGIVPLAQALAHKKNAARFSANLWHENTLFALPVTRDRGAAARHLLLACLSKVEELGSVE